MGASFGFHPEALFELSAATSQYLREGSARVANSFIAEVGAAVETLVADPLRWRIVEDPEIRRFALSGFPFVIYYRWERQHERLSIYGVMHRRRDPDHWRQ